MRIQQLFRLAPMLFAIFTTSCLDLDVYNTNEPLAESIYTDVDQIMEISSTTFRTFHNGINGYMENLGLVLDAMADNITMSWGQTYYSSVEPRNSLTEYYVNETSFAYAWQINGQWEEPYAAISHANTILQCLERDENADIDNKKYSLLKAFNLFVSGISHGYLGLIFDQATIVKYDTDLSTPVFDPYDEVIKQAIILLDEAIEISNTTSFQVPPEWLAGQEMTNIELSQLANSFAARILISSSRTKSDNDLIDWDQVLEYAQKGLEQDFSPKIGDAFGWHDMRWVYGGIPGWGRVDMRIINLLDHDYPSRWPADNNSWLTPDGNDPEVANAEDARLATDFNYLAQQNFVPSRGYYFFSHYRYSRYDYLRQSVWHGDGIKPNFMAWEVRLIEAEALLRLGNPDAALAILNDPEGPRKVRGKLPDIGSNEDILRYILDEKEIECMFTGMGISYFDMRRTDRLQAGTLLQFPVPAIQLEILYLEKYTFSFKPDGIEGSAGNWTGWDQQ